MNPLIALAICRATLMTAAEAMRTKLHTQALLQHLHGCGFCIYAATNVLLTLCLCVTGGTVASSGQDQSWCSHRPSHVTELCFPESSCPGSRCLAAEEVWQHLRTRKCRRHSQPPNFQSRQVSWSLPLSVTASCIKLQLDYAHIGLDPQVESTSTSMS